MLVITSGSIDPETTARLFSDGQTLEIRSRYVSDAHVSSSVNIPVTDDLKRDLIAICHRWVYGESAATMPDKTVTDPGRYIAIRPELNSYFFLWDTVKERMVRNPGTQMPLTFSSYESAVEIAREYNSDPMTGAGA